MANYTKPALRTRLKNKIMASSKGGKPGQWSARKAQMLAAEYKKAGGGYKGGKTAKQKSLKKWTGEKWRTSDKKNLAHQRKLRQIKRKLLRQRRASSLLKTLRRQPRPVNLLGLLAKQPQEKQLGKRNELLC